MAASRSLTLGLALSLIWGSALASEVDQTGSLAERMHQGMVLTAADPAPAMATLPEFKVVADVPRRGLRIFKMDKPWDPRICIGC